VGIELAIQEIPGKKNAPSALSAILSAFRLMGLSYTGGEDGNRTRLNGFAGRPSLLKSTAYGVTYFFAVVAVRLNAFAVQFKRILRGVWHAFPHPILMQPDWIGVPFDEIVGIKAFDQRGSPHSLLPPVEKNGHELRFAQGLRRFFGGCEFRLTMSRK
jgi:hypothetical protein